MGLSPVVSRQSVPDSRGRAGARCAHRRDVHHSDVRASPSTGISISLTLEGLCSPSANNCDCDSQDQNHEGRGLSGIWTAMTLRHPVVQEQQRGEKVQSEDQLDTLATMSSNRW